MDHEHHGHHAQPKGIEHAQHHHTDKHKGEHQPSKETDHSGHNEHAGHHTENFLKRFWLCLVITIPILLLSHMIQQWLGLKFTFTGDKYVLLALSSFIFFMADGLSWLDW